MAKEGFLTYLENYFEKHNIELKEMPFELRSIDKSFSIAAETIITEKYSISVSALRKKGYIKVDENNTMYIELESTANIRVIISNGFVKQKHALYINEKDFEKMAMGMDYITYQSLKNHLHLEKYLKDFKDIPSASTLIKESFKMVATMARRKDQKEKIKREYENDRDLMKNISQVYFMDPEATPKETKASSSTTTSTTKHDDISIYERHKRMMDLSPEKVIQAKGLNEDNSSYLVCLYNIDKLEDNSNLYVIIMEPKTSYKYTKTAYFKANKPITDEQFQDKATEYLQYDSNTFFSLANTTRFCHKSLEAFDEMLNALIFEEYNNPVHKNKLQIAKNTAEEFHQGIVKAKHK